MLHDLRDHRVAAGVTLLTAVVAIVAVLLLTPGGSEDGRPPRVQSVRAVDLVRGFVERRAGPGYMAWVGAWEMPEGDLMASYTTAAPREGDGSARRRAPQRVLDAFGFEDYPAERDFWDLDLSVRYQRSSDGGDSWTEVREDPFEALAPHAYSQQATTALPDGTIIRRVNGDDLRHDPAIPHTAFLQRLRPGAQEWSEPQVLMDPERFTYQITRIKRLGDGRLVATGNAWDVPARTRPADRRGAPSRYVLLVSPDDGETWREALTIPKDLGPLHGNEWDTAELPGGDLVAVMRTSTSPDASEPAIRTAILRENGGRWTMGRLTTPPFALSGHPALLSTREGVVLYVATTGVHWTDDGRTWRPLEFEGGDSYRSHYYPAPVQTADGRIHVFSHLGADDPFDSGRHGIVADAFRVEVDR